MILTSSQVLNYILVLILFLQNIVQTKRGVRCAEYENLKSAQVVLNLTAAASVRSHQRRRLFINTPEKTWIKQKSCLWGLLLEVVSILSASYPINMQNLCIQFWARCLDNVLLAMYVTSEVMWPSPGRLIPPYKQTPIAKSWRVWK